MSSLSMARKKAVADDALCRVVSTRLEICPISDGSFMPNFPNFLLHNVVGFVSHFLLALVGHADFQRRQIGCYFFADDGFCVFPICLTGYPDSIGPTELSTQYLHLFDIPGSSQILSCSSVLMSTIDSNSFLIQARSTGSPDSTKSSPCTRHFNLFGDDRTEQVKPYHLRNRVWPSFLELSFANFERRPWSHTYSCSTLHTCCCSRLSGSPPHTAGAQKKARETSHTTNAFFLGPHVVCEISSRPHWTENAYAVCIFRKKYPHASLRRPCARFSRDVRSIFCLGGEPL